MEFLENEFYGSRALHRVLTNSVICERLCHAYLFYGQQGIGKKTLAKRFAMAILCKGEGENKKPCFSCKSCKKLLGENHPDFFCFTGKGGKNSIHIDEIRAIRQDAFIRPNESDFKVYLIPDVQDMTSGAANAFLKVLEEPPSHAVFLLTAESKTSVYETILSRCIPFEVFPLEREEECRALKALRPDFSEEEREEAAALSNGVLGKALSFLDDENAKASADCVKAVVKAWLARSEYELMAALHRANSGREGMLLFISELTALLRLACLAKLSADNMKSESNSAAVSLAQGMTQSALQNAIKSLAEVKSGIEGNVNMGLTEGVLTAAFISQK